MTLIKPDGNGGTASEILQVAAEHFQRALTAFQQTQDRITAGEQIPSPDSDKTARLFAGATQVLFNEKQKIENSIKKDTGIVYDFAIDFAAAREEIRRRMARLRAAEGAGKISE